MTRTRSLLVALLTLGLLLPAAARAVTYPAGFEERTLLAGLDMPTGVDWTPDGRTLVIEKGGRLKVFAPGTTTPARVHDFSARVNARLDRGLLGLAVDLSFASNGYVYLLYTYELQPLSPDGAGPMVSQLLRLRLNAASDVVEQKVLLGSYVSGVCPPPSNTLDCIPSESESHSIGTVLSAPDGTLYVGSGDAASFSVVDPLALRTFDEQSMAGKILRIDRDGRGVAGHPFCPAETDLTRVCTKLHAKGLRNPFRFELRRTDAGVRGLVVGDVGWGTTEEVDLVSAGGRSYGWPCYEGPNRTSGYRDLADCQPIYAANAQTPPDWSYSRSGQSASVMGGPVYRGSDYPSGFRDSIFVGDYSQAWLKRLVVGSDGTVSAQGFATGWGATDITQHPVNGDIVFVSFGTGAPGTGSVKRIVYAPSNGTPTARASATPTTGSPPLAVQFDGRGSTDPDGDALTYRWTFGDGNSAAGPTASHTYAAAGSYTATLVVDDGRGRTASDSVTISVGNAAPTATIDAPADGALYSGGETITLRGSATDPQDGALPASALSWRVTLHHGQHTHPLLQADGVAQATFTALRDHDSDSFYEIELTARDGDGLTGTRKVAIRPRTAPLALRSSPAGARMSYGGTDVTAPFDTQAAVGFRTTISTEADFVRDGRRWEFAGWSDGGTRSHEITVPATATTLTATYRDAGPAGPVAALGFDEGTGSTASDSSGRGNAGTVAGATWTPSGRHGGALSLDGVDDWVTVADAASLDVVDAFTLSAWVKPAGQGRWDAVLIKEAQGDLAYGLYASNGGGPYPAAYAGPTGATSPTPLPAGEWHHLAATFDGTRVRVYVDGTQVTASAVAAGRPPVTDRPLRIGGTAVWDDEFFAGLVDEVRLYDRALSPAELAADADTPINSGSPPPPPPDTTAPTVALTAPAAGATVGGTVGLRATASDDTGVERVHFEVDGQTVGAVDTSAPYGVDWDTTTVANGAHTVSAVARDAAGNARTSEVVTVTVSNTAQPPPPPPGAAVVALGFDEGSGPTAADASGRGNDATLRGATWTSAGRYGGALSLDGTDDWATVADDPSLDLTGPMTLSAWVRPDTLGAWDAVLLKEQNVWASPYILYAASSGDPVPSAWAGALGTYGPARLTTGRWSHLTVTYDGATLRLYVDGTQVSTTPGSQRLEASTGPLGIGGSQIWDDEFFDGLIDEVRVYDRALIASEVAAVRDAPVGGGTPPPPPPPPAGPVAAYGFDESSGTTAVDGSGTGNTGTISGAARTSAGRFGGALGFDGKDDRVTVPDAASLDLTSAMTVAAWVRLRSTRSNQTVALKEASGSTRPYGLHATSSSGPRGWFDSLSVTAPAAIPQNAWTHVATTYAAGVQRLFVNGQQVASRTALRSADPSSGPLRIGGTAQFSRQWLDGWIDEVRVYDRALSAAELATAMQTPVQP